MSREKEIQKISPETKRKLMDAVNEELREIGLPTFDDIDRLAKELDPYNITRLAMLSGLERAINQMPEPTPQEFESTLAEIKGKMRYEVRAKLSQATQDIKKKLPRKPSGGRQDSLTQEQKRKACDDVAALIRNKVPYKNALMRVGQRFGVSSRTIQRAWQERDREI